MEYLKKNNEAALPWAIKAFPEKIEKLLAA